MPAKRSKKPLYQRKHASLYRFGLFLIVFAAIGGGIMLLKSSAAIPYVSYPPHRASCVQNTPSQNFVKPGQTFTAVVQMKNTGTSTWGPGWGTFLSEFSSVATSGVVTWNASGATMSGNVGHNGTATFNLTLRAPSTPGNYNFSWGMHFVYQGYIHDPCPNKTVTVKNPPAVSLNLNGQPSNISVTQGAGLTLSWSASNGATSCTASGNWSGAKSPPSGGTENRTGDTAAIGTRSYTLQCSNEVGAGASVTRTVVVNAAPPASSPKPPTPSPKPSSSSNPVPVVTTDTTPPSAPGNFQAAYNETAVDLRWNTASDDHGIRGYELERSVDQASWQKIGDIITSEAYTDEDVNFQTTYYYRLRAIDSSGNVSANSMAEVTTGSFEPNVKADEALVLTSDDGVAEVTIPAGAIGGEVASCDLRSSRYLYPSQKNYSSISGPYELLCKLASGDRVTVFDQPVTVQVILSDFQKKQYTDFKFYTRATDWEEVKDVSPDNSFVLGDSTDFALIGKTKKTPLWQKILITLFVIAAIVGAGLIGLTRVYRWRLRRQLEQQNRDSYNKERGY